MTNPVREYVPTQPKPSNQPQPQPVYELKSTVTGKVLPPTIIGVGEYKIQVPFAPKSNCKKCMGKGYLGIDSNNKKVFLCQKCYPNMTLKKN
jgi:hypothetical protein